MKITKRQLRQIIKEALLLEEPSDYLRDYKAGTISYSEYKQLVRDFEKRSSSYSRQSSASAGSSPKPPPTPEKKWKGSREDLEQKVHDYLIDIGFYEPYNHIRRVNPFSKGSHPDGGYTSNIPGVIKAGIASGEIDWATWSEIEPTYKKIDRSID